jgi:hypothetical protein
MAGRATAAGSGPAQPAHQQVTAPDLRHQGVPARTPAVGHADPPPADAGPGAVPACAAGGLGGNGRLVHRLPLRRRRYGVGCCFRCRSSAPSCRSRSFHSRRGRFRPPSSFACFSRGAGRGCGTAPHSFIAWRTTTPPGPPDRSRPQAPPGPAARSYGRAARRGPVPSAGGYSSTRTRPVTFPSLPQSVWGEATRRQPRRSTRGRRWAAASAAPA